MTHDGRVADAAPAPQRVRASAALLAALALTAANAGKPLVIDDPVYVEFARQALAHPGDPYGFEVYWYRTPEPAIGFGWVPPVLSYWLAGAIALFGEHPFAWKLSLLPFALALTGSLAFLLRRWARPLAAPVVFLLALGPAVLPSLNLMLDVPALALGVLGYALFVAASERRNARLALASGLALGLAMQTKYSAAVYPALVLAHAADLPPPARGGRGAGRGGGPLRRLGGAADRALRRVALPGRLRAAAHARLSPGGRQGRRGGARKRGALLDDLPALAAGRHRALSRPARGRRARRGPHRWWRERRWSRAPRSRRSHCFPARRSSRPSGFFARLAAYNPELLIFVPLGVFVAWTVVAVGSRGLRELAAAREGERDPRPDRVLAVWLLLETAGYFLISPYPAVRRVIGIGVAATLLAARAASPRAQDPDARAGIRIAHRLRPLLSALYFTADLSDARARQALAARIVERMPQLGADPRRETVWYNGHWELQYYLEQAGMQPVIAGRSQLRPRGLADPLRGHRGPRRSASRPAASASRTSWSR